MENISTGVFRIYPNPFNEIPILKIKDPLTNSYFEVSDATGKLILRREIRSEKSVIDFTAVQKGFYFLHIKTGTQNMITKIVK